MRRFGFAALAAWLVLTASAIAHCTLQATILLQPMASGHFVLSMDVGSKPLRFLIDTGASNSLLTARAAEATGLQRQSMANGNALGGAAVKDYVTAPDVGLGGLPQGPIPFAILSAPLPVDGIIGLDILSRYDVTFDFPSARMLLYAPGACTPAGQAIAYTTERGHIVLTALVDGKPITAWLDSGAQQSLLSRETADATFTLDPAKLSPAKPPRQAYRFDSVAIGAAVHSAPTILLAPDASLSFRDKARMLVGIDILKQHRLFIAFGRQTLFLTP